MYDVALMKEKVKKGAAFLDEREPNWYNNINLSTLNMCDGCNCIIGQITTCQYCYVIDEFFPYENPADYGFIVDNEDSETDNEEYDMLNILWSNEIEKRRTLLTV